MEQNKKPRNKPLRYGQLVFHKGGKKMQWREDSAPPASGAGEGDSHMQGSKARHTLRLQAKQLEMA